MLPNSGPQASEGRSIEQREREYAEAKARIFNSSRESSLSKEEDSHRWVCNTACCQATEQGKPLWYLFCLRDNPLCPTTLHACSADNDGFGSEAGSEEGSQRSETVDATPIFYRGPTRKKREYRQTQPFQTYIGESLLRSSLYSHFILHSIPISVTTPSIMYERRNVVLVHCAQHCIHEMCP